MIRLNKGTISISIAAVLFLALWFAATPGTAMDMNIGLITQNPSKEQVILLPQAGGAKEGTAEEDAGGNESKEEGGVVDVVIIAIDIKDVNCECDEEDEIDCGDDDEAWDLADEYRCWCDEDEGVICDGRIKVNCECNIDGGLNCVDEEETDKALWNLCICDEGEYFCQGIIEVDCECDDENELKCADEDAEDEADEYRCECTKEGKVFCAGEEPPVEVDCSCSDEELECEKESEEEKADAYGCYCDEDDEIICEGEEFRLGKTNFGSFCARCHGFEGDGQGEASHFTYPKPRDFTMGMFKFRTTPSGSPPTDDDLMRTIKKGLPGTSMFGWERKLTDENVMAIIYYIKTAFSYEAFEFEEEPFDIGEPPPASDELIQLGKETFKNAKCWECHGMLGRGDGEKGRQPDFKDDWGSKIWPTTLLHPWELRNGSRVEDIYRSITTALDGTPMPSFSDAYSDEKRWGIAHYIKSMQLVRKTGSRIKLSEVEDVPFSVDDKKWEEVEYLDLKMEVRKVFAKPLLSMLTNMRVRGVYNDSEIAIMLEWIDKQPDRGDNDFPPDAIRLQFPVQKGDLNIWYWSAFNDSASEHNATGQQANMTPQKRNDLKSVSIYDLGRYRLIFKRSLQTADSNDVNFKDNRSVPFSVIAYDGKNMEEGARGAVSRVFYMDR